MTPGPRRRLSVPSSDAGISGSPKASQPALQSMNNRPWLKHTQTYMHKHIHMHVHVHVHIHTCTHMFTHTQTHMCVPTCMYIYMELAYKVGLNSQSICLYLCEAKHICSLTLKRAIKISVAIPRHKHSLCRPLVMLEYLQRTCIFPQVKCILKKQTWTRVVSGCVF